MTVTPKALLEKRAALTAQFGELQAAFAAGNATPEQRAKGQALLAEIATLDTDIDVERRMREAMTPTQKIMEAAEKRQYSIGRLFRSMARLSNEDAGFELEVAQELRAKNPGMASTGVLVPFERRSSESTTLASPGVVASNLQPMLPALYPQTVLEGLGVRVLSGLVGDLEFPINSTSIVGTGKGEIATADRKQLVTNQVKATPHRLPVELAPSKQLLLQTATSAEQFLADEIGAGMASQMEYYALQGSGANGCPLGLMNWTGRQTVANANTTWILADANSAVNKVFEANMPASDASTLNWVVRPNAAGFIESKPVSTNAAAMVAQNGQIAGYRYVKSTNMPTGKLVFGPWREMVWCLWGALDLVVDPYSAAATGLVKITATSFFDSVILRPTLFVDNTTAITA